LSLGGANDGFVILVETGIQSFELLWIPHQVRNDEQQISSFICGCLRFIRSFDFAQDMIIGNKHVWKNKANFQWSRM